MPKILAVIVILLAGAALAVYTGYFLPPPMPHSSVTVGGTTYIVEIADTPAKQELGLGQRDSLAQGRGMLFVFERPGNWGFWMKDTRFPLDMIWARADGTVINVARNVATSTYAQNPPEVLYPTEPDALYVLEVNAGAAAQVMPGQKMTITL